MTIAVIKATFVVLYFMHVRYSSRLIWVILASALFWMAILFAFTFSDYWTRDWISIDTETSLARLQRCFPHLDQALTRRAVQANGGV